MAKTFLLEGDITAADTFTALTTRGSETAPSLQLPLDWKKITKLTVIVCVDIAAAGSAIFILRLTGNAISRTQDIVVGGAGGQLPQAGSDVAPKVGIIFELEDADIDTSGGDTITVQAAMTDTDLGTAGVVVQLVGG